MGVDARMFAIVRGAAQLKNEDQVLAAARELAAVIGPEHFMITKGRKLFAGWPAAELHHALSVIEPLSEKRAAEYDMPHLAGKVAYFQDGDPFVAVPGDQLIEAHLMTRYYHEDYARGHWPTIRAVAEWLEFKFPGCEVWYGGDSSGAVAERFDARRRAELNLFYLETGHSTYESGFQRRGGAGPICPACEVPLLNCGGGGRERAQFWHCASCGSRAVTSDALAEARWLELGEDYFDASAEAPPPGLIS